MTKLTEVARFRALGPRSIDEISARYGISEEIARTVRTVSYVLPFRVNEYVLSQLIDWRQVPEDPIFQLVFPQRGMLTREDERRLSKVADEPGGKAELNNLVRQLRAGMNPHPSGQIQFNVPKLHGAEVQGVQHKYRETVLYFPGHGQTCHTYCTYCFRWAQFVGDADLRFAAPNPKSLISYLGHHPEVSDVLLTGGDPMVMSTDRLRSHVEPLLTIDTIRTVRIGTKSVAYWPYRFVTDRDSDDVLRLFERVVATGRQLAIMAHFSHPRELESDIAREAISRIRSTGASVYCQAPVIAHVNDKPSTLSELWRAELSTGAVPYYMFVERDTGPQEYFKVPLARALEIFQIAYSSLPGLARTIRGPVISATAGKVVLDGVEGTSQGRFFQLRMLQARDPALVGRPFRAHYSTSACWLDELILDKAAPADIQEAIHQLKV
ncbi:KamA family radical SAM protein [Streptomyces sp. NPDC021218]|uniref:KamA family radical SAM protein n=1 Tax=Streptomyces sp. NPDC021218 TaxID=3365119 RepID=UPI0037BB5B54